MGLIVTCYLGNFTSLLLVVCHVSVINASLCKDLSYLYDTMRNCHISVVD